MIDNQNYIDFLSKKRIRFESYGMAINKNDVHPMLFDFQRDIVVWAAKKGRAAVFADTGLGKTFIQLEWARLIGEKTIIVAPLSVARQTAREAKKIGIDVHYVRHQDEIKNGHNIYITNYEMIEHFDASEFGAVVLDESSILKAMAGKTRRRLTKMFSDTPYRLACTATPAPNDRSEIGNHSEFLGITRLVDMLAMFFIHANKIKEGEGINGIKTRKKLSNTKGQEWRLKNHAHESFYRWMASWAMSIRKPSDLGYDDGDFELPPLHVIPEWIPFDYTPDDQLVFTGLKGIQDRRKVRRATLEIRTQKAAALVNASDEQWIVWTDLNEESRIMASLIPDAVEVIGAHSPESKAKSLEAFQDGKHRVLVSKPRIAGFGMNFQNAHNQVFVGLSDSWEKYYQAIRRSYRFGQTQPVNIHIVLTEIEREILDNIMRKEKIAYEMSKQLIASVRTFEKQELETMSSNGQFEYQEDEFSGENWRALLGDSSTRLAEIDESSVDLSVYSPPFADLYTYSASEMDLGNSRNWDEFFGHYAYIIQELLRVTKPGRLTCVHTADIPAMAVKDGYIGVKDFPGAVIKAYEDNGWIFTGRAIVGKNPQAQAIRTKAKALLFTQLRKDSSHSRPAILDQVLLFKKPGDNKVPVRPVENNEMNNETWIDWASGVWLDISESDTLQYTTARGAEDEKHICPLQLGTIERCIKLYSNPGETVLTPFMGIGSEAYEAVRLGRKAIGIELKESYYRVAVQNLRDAEAKANQMTLFSLAEMDMPV